MLKYKIIITLILFCSYVYAGAIKVVPTSAPIPIKKQSNRFNLHFFGSLGLIHFNLKDLDSKEKISSTAPFIKFGIELNRYFNLETIYANSISNSRYKAFGKSKNINSHFKQLGIYLKAKYPIKNFKPYIILGVEQTKITHLKKSTQKQNSFAYGVGFEYRLNSSFSLEAFYKKDYKDKGFGNRAKQDIIKLTSFGINLNYRY